MNLGDTGTRSREYQISWNKDMGKATGEEQGHESVEEHAESARPGSYYLKGWNVDWSSRGFIKVVYSSYGLQMSSPHVVFQRRLENVKA